jgi:hypothetical protein
MSIGLGIPLTMAVEGYSIYGEDVDSIVDYCLNYY